MPSGLYKEMDRIVNEISDQSDISSVLEVGCGKGSFVIHLRDQGFEAYGIDLDDEEFLADGLVQGNASYLNMHFGDKLFDLIIANRSLSFEAYGNVLIDQRCLGRLLSHDLALVEIQGRENSMNILRSAFEQIKPGKFFAAVEDYTEELLFSSNDAMRVGYKVLKYNGRIAKLQKP